MRWAGTWHIKGTGKMHKEFCWGDLRERDHLEDLGLGERIILNGSSISDI
jgi:hypothetical protein